jgi:hypothetical protein
MSAREVGGLAVDDGLNAASIAIDDKVAKSFVSLEEQRP